MWKIKKMDKKRFVGSKWLQTVLFIFLMSVTQFAAADLPKQVQADLLQDEIVSALKNGQMHEAKVAIKKYRTLGIEVPPTIMIIEAKVAITMKEYLHAKTVLEQYFEEAGTKHKSYQKALALYKQVRGPATEIKKEKDRLTAISKKQAAVQAKMDKLKMQCDKGNRDQCANLGYEYDTGKEVASNNALAFKYYKRSCELKSAMGCNNLGTLYQSGRGTPQDFPKAFNSYKWSCEHNNIKFGCSNLAVFYEKGWGTKKDLTQARKLVTQSCKAGKNTDCNKLKSMPKTDKFELEEFVSQCSSKNAFSCTQAGLFYSQGKGASVNSDLAEEYFTKACKWSSAAGCFHLGQTEKSNVTNRFKLLSKACRLNSKQGCMALEKTKQQLRTDNDPLELACNNGKGRACTDLGERYDNGNEAVLDDKKAVALFQKACDLNNAKGCNILGVMQNTGEGTKVDLKSAVKNYRKACEGGYFEKGCYNLAEVYRDGEGVSKSFRNALKYFSISCENNYGPGCNSLGLLYKKGNSIGKNENGAGRNNKKAATFFTKACLGGDRKYGCYNLGLAYLKGLGVKKDKTKAQEYFWKSCNAGAIYNDSNAPACKELKVLRGY